MYIYYTEIGKYINIFENKSVLWNYVALSIIIIVRSRSRPKNCHEFGAVIPISDTVRHLYQQKWDRKVALISIGDKATILLTLRRFVSHIHN